MMVNINQLLKPSSVTLRKIEINHFKSLLNIQPNILFKQINQNKSVVRASYVVIQLYDIEK